MMFSNVVLVLLLVVFLVFARIVFARLAVIHALTNSGMGSALSATVVALRSDAKSKQYLAKHIGGSEYIAAAEAADLALVQGLDLLKKHNLGQVQADKGSKTLFFK
jgi:hypothetical protein